MFAPYDATQILLAGVSVAKAAASGEVAALDLFEEADFEELPASGISVGCEEADFTSGGESAAGCLATVNVFADRDVEPSKQREWVRELLVLADEDEVFDAMAQAAFGLGWKIQRCVVGRQRHEVSGGVRSMKTDFEMELVPR